VNSLKFRNVRWLAALADESADQREYISFSKQHRVWAIQ